MTLIVIIHVIFFAHLQQPRQQLEYGILIKKILISRRTAMRNNDVSICRHRAAFALNQAHCAQIVESSCKGWPHLCQYEDDQTQTCNWNIFKLKNGWQMDFWGSAAVSLPQFIQRRLNWCDIFVIWLIFKCDRLSVRCTYLKMFLSVVAARPDPQSIGRHSQLTAGRVKKPRAIGAYANGTWI